MSLSRRQAPLHLLRFAPLLFLLTGMLAPVAQCAESDDLLASLKVAYIYNFTRFIDWPEPRTQRPFVIGVIGDDVMQSHLRVLEHDGKRVEGRPIAIRTYASAEAIGPADILFIGTAAEDQLDGIVRHTAGTPSLLIGDTPGYARRGVAIELYPKADVFRRKERLRFRIAPAALKDRGLVVSAQLYDVAEVIE